MPELRDLRSEDRESTVRTLPDISVLPETSISVYGDWLMVQRDNRYGWLYDIGESDPPRERIVLHEDADSLRHVAVSPAGKWLIMRLDDTAGLWDLTARDPYETGDEVTPDGESVSAIAITRDGRWALIGTESGTIRLMNLVVDDPFSAPIDLAAHSDEILRFVTSPGGRWMLAESRDKVVRIWDMHAVARGSNSRVPDGGGAALWPEPFSADDRWLLTRGADGVARLWDLDAGNDDPFVLDRGGQIYRAWMLPGNRKLVTLDGEDRLYLWSLDAADPSLSAKRLRGAEGKNPKLAFGHGKTRLAVFGNDDTDVRLWDLSTTDPSQSMVLLRGHTGDITTARFTPDNRWLITSSNDGTIRLWPLEIKHLFERAAYVAGRNLSRAEWDLYFPGEAYRKTFPQLRWDHTAPEAD